MLSRANIVILQFILATGATKADQYNAILFGNADLYNMVVGYLEFVQSNLTEYVIVNISIDMQNLNLQDGVYFLVVHEAKRRNPQNMMQCEHRLGPALKIPVLAEFGLPEVLQHPMIIINRKYHRREPFCYTTLLPNTRFSLVNRIIGLYGMNYDGSTNERVLLACGDVQKMEEYRSSSVSDHVVVVEDNHN